VLGIGDRLTTDVAGAIAAGHDGALVLTGASSHADLDGGTIKPAHVAATFAELVLSPE
jgi:glycerol-1-phosphatase